MAPNGKLSLAVKLQMAAFILTILVICGSMLMRVATAENRIVNLENENKELKTMVSNMNIKIDAIYLKLIPNAK